MAEVAANRYDSLDGKVIHLWSADIFVQPPVGSRETSGVSRLPDSLPRAPSASEDSGLGNHVVMFENSIALKTRVLCEPSQRDVVRNVKSSILAA